MLLFVFCGESFRTGNQHTRVKGLPESVPEQLEAARSHVRLMEAIERRTGVRCAVVIESYRTPHSDLLTAEYGDMVLVAEYHDRLLGGPVPLFKRGVEVYKNTAAPWAGDATSGVVFCRIDAIFHEDYHPHISVADKRVMYLFGIPCGRESIYRRGFQHPPLTFCDIFIYFPWEFVAKNKLSHYRATGDFHTRFPTSVNPEGNGVYFTSIHDSDSAKDYNPIYRIANRRPVRTRGQWLWPKVRLILGPSSFKYILVGEGEGEGEGEGHDLDLRATEFRDFRVLLEGTY